jgi:hypothetical protein
MLEPNLFLVFLEPLNRATIQYMVTGSVACVIYGEPRLTGSCGGDTFNPAKEQ